MKRRTRITMKRKKNKNVVLFPIVCLLVFIGTGCGSESESTSIDLYEVKKGDLTISVLENGTIKALEKVDIRSLVEGNNTILYLIEEGIRITEEDVKNGKVLVRLDSSTLLSRRDDQEASVNNAKSAYKQAEISLEIQRNENESAIASGELTAHFAKMDLEKYLGETLVEKVMAQYAKLKDSTNTGPVDNRAKPDMDYEDLAQSKVLGGEALQERRILESDIELANEEVTLARNTLEWTNRLLEKGYVTKDEAEADALSLKRKKIELERTQTERDLFLRYDFAKNTEKLLSDYHEAKKELERVGISCKGREDKALDDVNAKKRNLEIHKDKLKKYNEQIANCIIRATKPGLVVYANLDKGWRGSGNPIQEGTSVKENQIILTIPNLNEMGVEVRIMEGSSHMIKVGMPATIKIDRDETLQISGEVKKVASVADSADIFRGNPQPTYPTDIEIHDAAKYELKPGMTAKVAILVQELKDVIYVSLQGVHIYKGKPVCYVKDGGSYKCVPVKLGASNIDFVHVKDGLAEGDKILLREPRAGEDVIIDESQFAEEEPANRSKKPQKSYPEKTGDTKSPKSGEHSTKKPPSGDGNLQPPAGTQPSGISDDQKRMIFKLMQELSEDEKQKFMTLLKERKIDMQAISEALSGKSPEEQAEYLRKNVLNK